MSDWIATGVTSTAAVHNKGANALGLRDMSGNVWEWCFDLYNGSYRVRRGGSWINDTRSLRVGYWYYDSPYWEADGLGFRFARTH
jgi:formylglycine-generating enzyme